MEEKILKLAMDLSGAGEAREETLKLLCVQAAEELAGRLREGLSAEDCGSAFPVAAAWLALADLRAGDASAGVTGFSAGSLSIQTGESQAGEVLRRRAYRLLSAQLRDSGLCFRGVRGG